MPEQCLVCGSHIWKKYSDIEEGKFGFFICKSCSFSQLYPIPSQVELDDFYSKLYRDAYSDNCDVNKDVLAYEKKRADRVVKVLKPYFNKDTHNILDVGCSSGTLLQNIEKLSTCVVPYGMEMNERYRQYIVKNKIVDSDKITNQNINSFYEGQEGKFDFISIVHVLEHLKSPKEALESIYKLLSVDGLLYIEVPNLKTPYNNLRKEYLAIYHLYYFTEYTLRRLLTFIGFKILHQEQIAGTSICFVCQKTDGINQNNQSKVNQYNELLLALKRYERRYPILKYVLKLKGKLVGFLELLRIKDIIKSLVAK